MFKNTSLLDFFQSRMFITQWKKTKTTKDTPKTKRGKVYSQEEQESPNATWAFMPHMMSCLTELEPIKIKCLKIKYLDYVVDCMISQSFPEKCQQLISVIT